MYIATLQVVRNGNNLMPNAKLPVWRKAHRVKLWFGKLNVHIFKNYFTCFFLFFFSGTTSPLQAKIITSWKCKSSRRNGRNNRKRTKKRKEWAEKERQKNITICSFSGRYLPSVCLCMKNKQSCQT